jgi:hypothetical protein
MRLLGVEVILSGPSLSFFRSVDARFYIAQIEGALAGVQSESA